MKKTNKSLLAVLISVLVIIPVLFTSCESTTSESLSSTITIEDTTTTNPEKEESYPKNEVAMWEVTSKDTDAKLYLMGSIHAAKPDTFPLRKEITDAFEKSDYLAVEANIKEFEKDVSAQLETAQKCIYSDGSKIYDHISKDTYEKAKAFLLSEKQYAEVYDMYSPFMWSSLIENALVLKSDIAIDEGVDYTLIGLAEDAGKEVLEVESMDFQLDMSLGFPDELYDIMINETIDNADAYPQELNDLYSSWHSGDLEKFIEEFDEEPENLTDEQKQLYEDYNKQMLTDRNIGMANKAAQYLSENKNVFFVVGFMHMIGDDGIVELLKDKGFTVKRV